LVISYIKKIKKMDFKQILLMTIPVLLITLWKFLNNSINTAKELAAHAVISLVFAIYFVPVIVNYYNLAQDVAYVLVAIFTIIAGKLVTIIEKRIPEKINEKIDKL
jgi:hypothetical protein